MTKKSSQKNKKQDKGSLFIPAGIFLGMGFGFLYDQIIPGIFIGLGAGFILFAIVNSFSKEKK